MSQAEVFALYIYYSLLKVAINICKDEELYSVLADTI